MASNIHGLNSNPSNCGGSGNGGGGGFGGFPGSMGGGSGGGQQASCKDQMKAGWESIPWFNKFILSSCLVIYLISWVLP